MSCTVFQFIARAFLLVLFLSLAADGNARPSLFGDTSNQRANEADNNALNIMENGLKPWQMELYLERIANANRYNANGEFGGFESLERALRSASEIKRKQSNYRLCYFNPVSCFRK